MQKENLHFCTWSTNYHIPCPSTHHKDTSQCQEAFFLTRSNTKLPILSFHIYIHMSHGLFLLSLIFVVASVYFDDTCCGKVFIYISFPWKKNIIKVILGPLMFLPPDLFVSLYTAHFFVFFLFFSWNIFVREIMIPTTETMKNHHKIVVIWQLIYFYWM